jgi:integrase
MAKILTAAAVERLKGGRVRREVRDGGCKGLYLVIQPSGAKSFALRFRRPDGSSGKLTLGPVYSGKELSGEPTLGGPLTLEAAHQLAAEQHRMRALGHDVIKDAKTAKHRRRTEVEEGAASAFGALVPRFIADYARRKTRRWGVTARLLGLRYAKDGSGEPTVIKDGLCDRWAVRPVSEIDGADIYSLVDEAKRVSVPGLKRRNDGPADGQARAMFAALSGFFGWCTRHRRCALNPCRGVHRPEAGRARDRVLNNGEIVKFWHVCDEVGEPFGQALRLLLLTGCRVREVSEMRRSELSEDGATWTVPSERTKNHRVCVVPLPSLARDIIASGKQIASKDGYLFTLNGRVPVSVGSSKIKHKIDKEMKPSQPWRLHDVRRTAATGMAELGIAPHIIEACLNHVSGARAGVAGVYNRAAYASEKKAALERWASHVQGLVSGKPANVVALTTKGRGK